MIKSHEKEVPKMEIVVDHIFCNCCGNEIRKENLKWDEFLADHLHVEKLWNYFSSHDSEHHQFDICEDCYEKWIKTFKIPIENTECM